MMTDNMESVKSMVHAARLYRLLDGSVDIGVEKVVREGTLTKQGAIHKTWKSRWFVVTASGCVLYFKNAKAFPIGGFVLHRATILLLDGELVVKSPVSYSTSSEKRRGEVEEARDRVFKMRAKTADELRLWESALLLAQTSASEVVSKETEKEKEPPSSASALVAPLSLSLPSPTPPPSSSSSFSPPPSSLSSPPVSPRAHPVRSPPPAPPGVRAPTVPAPRPPAPPLSPLPSPRERPVPPPRTGNTSPRSGTSGTTPSSRTSGTPSGTRLGNSSPRAGPVGPSEEIAGLLASLRQIQSRLAAASDSEILGGLGESLLSGLAHARDQMLPLNARHRAELAPTVALWRQLNEELPRRVNAAKTPNRAPPPQDGTESELDKLPVHPPPEWGSDSE